MKINEKPSAIIMERVLDCQDEYELIELVSGRDKRRIPIHRVILMAASKYFANLFRANDSNEKPREILIDACGGVIETVVNFCYSGHIDLTAQNVESCVAIATDSEIDLLLNECHDYLAVKLCIETVVETLLIAAKHNLDDLQQRATQMLCSNFEQVSATHILRLNPAMMSHLMKNADVAVSSDLFAERLLSWFKFAEAERGEHMPELLRLIRLEKLTAESLCGTIEPLFKQFKCTELLYDQCEPSSGFLSIDDKKTTSDEIEVFSMSIKWQCKGWFPQRTLIVDRYDASLNEFKRRYTLRLNHFGHTSYILYENKIYATGERPNIAYDLETGEEEELLPMNEQRSSHISILMGKLLYVFGGRDGAGTQMVSCERYDTEKRTWQTIKSMIRGRSSASAAILNGLIYVVGGFEDRDFLSTFVESYNPISDEWTKRMAIDVTSTYWGPLVTFNGMLYAFVTPFENGHGVREYDPEKNMWAKIETGYEFRSVVSANGNLFGVTNKGQIGEVTINKRKIDFAERTKVEISNYRKFSLHVDSKNNIALPTWN